MAAPLHIYRYTDTSSVYCIAAPVQITGQEADATLGAGRARGTHSDLSQTLLETIARPSTKAVHESSVKVRKAEVSKQCSRYN